MPIRVPAIPDQKVLLGFEPLNLWDNHSTEECLSESYIDSILDTIAKSSLDYLFVPVDLSEVRFSLEVPRTSKNIETRKTNVRAWIENEAHKDKEELLSPATDMQISSNTRAYGMAFTANYTSFMDDQGLSKTASTFCETMLTRQTEWASHASPYAFVLPAPSCYHKFSDGTITWNCLKYAAAIARHVHNYILTRLWIRIPLVLQINDSPTDNYFLDGWQVWNQIRTIVGKPGLEVVLELPNEVPLSEDIFDRWIAEPIRVIIIPSSILRHNTSGLLTLPKMYKKFLLKIIQSDIHIVFQSKISDDITSILKPRISCIDRILHSIPSLTPKEEFELPCIDKLQSPLQPLRDNLESVTYETFEQDPIKYAKYKDAILACLQDRIQAGHTKHNITVVGAGRGPLVVAALQALKLCEISKLTAVEKNPNAVITLRSRIKNDNDWKDVEIISGDMRTYEPKIKSHILVSELLGSFGDNELSPECLDGAGENILSEDGVSIPTAYYSSLEPISTPKLWEQCNSMGTHNNGICKSLETLYVVKIRTAWEMSKEGPKKCFEFEHPNKDSNLLSNKRHKTISFTAKTTGVCHGFACYFHCYLYKDITISINPATVTEGMFSWFPIYMPIKQPLWIKESEIITIWRQTDTKQVWYEWLVSSPQTSELHNVGGRSYAIML